MVRGRGGGDMDTTLTIALPVHPAVFAVFLGILVVALVYSAIKFALSIVTGG